MSLKDKILVKLCKMYCKLYLKRVKNGYIPTKEESIRFVSCLKTVLIKGA